MNVYLISYDLRKPGQNYTPLYDAIKAYGDWQHPMESLWAVYAGGDADSISDNLRKHLDDNDCLFVARLADRDRQGWMPRSFWEWLKDKEQ